MHPTETPALGRSLSASGIVAAIPARFTSTRLPGKPLLSLAGKPMIQHVYERVAGVAGLSRVVVLTDDERIAEAVAGFGGACEMTPPECASGTDRIAWAAREWTEGAVINVQGDEPLIEPAVVAAVAAHLAGHPEDPMVTLAAPIEPAEGTEAGDLANPNAVKVVLSLSGHALYFSRSAIPYPRQPGAAAPLKHIGLYGYQRETLLRLAGLSPTPLERSESLEQLRALENGIPIRVLLVPRASPGVDTAEDLARAERELAGGAGPASTSI